MKYYCTLILSLFILLGVPLAPTAIAGQIDDVFLNPSAYDTIEWLPQAPADHRIKYVINSLTYGDLRLPKQANPEGHPVLVFIHGGGWTENWSLDYPAALVEALTGAGLATWNIEFRRIGNNGGGWPGTFLDVALATDFLREIAPIYNLDLDRVVVSGHSSGGHLALWVGSRHVIPEDSPLYMEDPLPIAGVLSLAGIPDLERALTEGGRTDVLTLLGEVTPEEAMDLYDEASPKHMLPTGVPTSHIVGTFDNPWRQMITEEFVELAEALGDEAIMFNPEGANHFDVVDPCGPAWPIIVSEALRLLGEKVPPQKINTSPFCPVAGR